MKKNFKLFLALLIAVVMVGNKEVSAFTYRGNPDSITTRAVTSGDFYRGDQSVSSGYGVRAIFDTEGYQYFCLEKNGNIPESGTGYKLGDRITDDGIVYLVNALQRSTTTPQQSMLDTWSKQTALWMYQKQLGAAKSDNLTDAMITAIKQDTYLYNDSDPFIEYPETADRADTIYNKQIKDLVETALKIHNGQASYSTYGGLGITINSKDIIKTDDSKYYKSDLITINNMIGDTSSTYKLTLTNAPEGTRVVLEDGTVVSSEKYETMSITNNKLYIEVPADKVTEETKSITVQVQALSYAAYTYTPVDTSEESNFQKLAYPSYGDVIASINVEMKDVVNVPDTAMNLSKALSIFGIVLVGCGTVVIGGVLKRNKTQVQKITQD